MKNTVNTAVIGLGFGAELIPIYQSHPNAHVHAICRRNEAELNKVGDDFGIERRYTKYEDVLSDPDVDFVHINSPIPDHAWMTLAALDAGKHVMCTVPMATTPTAATEIQTSFTKATAAPKRAVRSRNPVRPSTTRATSRGSSQLSATKIKIG